MMRETITGFALFEERAANTRLMIGPLSCSARFKGDIKFSPVSIDKDQNGFIGTQL
jgi:hypothetical protein